MSEGSPANAPFETTTEQVASPTLTGQTLTVDPNATTDSEPAGMKPPLPEMVGRFIVRSRLGEGAFGEVFRAFDPRLDRELALKVARPGTLTTPLRIQRFLREARAAANLRHPHLVPLFETGEEAGRYYIASAFIPGGTLEAHITAASGPLPFARTATLIRLLAEALGYAHRQGIVHRDVKPANVLLDEHGEPMLADFGLAARADGDEKLTHEGAILGTPAYMSPEQAEGNSADVGPTSDQYALGVMLYEMLTGQRPFTGTVPAVMAAHVNDSPVSPRSLNRAVPRDLETICLKCLEKTPARRYATCEDLAEDLRRWLASEPIRARQVGIVERTARWIRRNPVGAAFILLLITTVVVVSGLAWQLAVWQREAEQARDDEAAERIRTEGERKKAEDERKRAETAREVTAKQREIALNTVQGVLVRVDNLIKDNPGLASVRVEIIREMLKDLDQIREQALKNPLADRTEAIALSRIGEIYFNANRIQDAATCYSRAHELLDALARATPTDPTAIRRVALLSAQFAEAEHRLGYGPKARELFTQALKLHQEYVKLLESSGEGDTAKAALLDVAEAWQRLAYHELREGDYASALEHYLVAEKSFTDLPEPFVHIIRVRRTRSEMQVRIGDCKWRLNRLDEAETHFRNALAEREKELKDSSGSSTPLALLKTDLGQSRMYLGDFFMEGRKQREEASREYDQALKIFTELLKTEPGSLDLQQRISSTWYRLGLAATTPEKAAEAYRECLPLKEKLAKIDRRDMQASGEYALVLGKLGRAAEVELLARRMRRYGTNDVGSRLLMIEALKNAAENTPESDSIVSCRDEAFAILDDLVRERRLAHDKLAEHPYLGWLKKDPRFAVLVSGKTLPRPPAEP